MAKAITASVMKQKRQVPWLYLLPAIIVMTIFILYPMLNTVSLSFGNANGTASAATTCREGQPCWGVFENYRYALTNELNTTNVKTTWDSFWVSSYGNMIKWLLVMVTGTVGIGLVFAVLVDRIKQEALAKSIIFMPMAISFVGAGVIWKFVYNYGTSQVQTGILNAIITGLGFKPVSWLTESPLNTYMLVVVGVWMWTGFCMTLLSSAIKSIPEEIIEASRIDGAKNFEIFTKIQVPIIAPTIVVVITTMVINVLKLFDIVYVMTGGNYGTNVIATRMYTEMYTNAHYGRGTAIAVILILFIIPFIVMNIRRFTKQEAMR
ncbi:MAG: sugar ABC transporter permease [Anaerolineaceae bacterium]|jgi:alpha-glucoside transport system permease protein|nr:sugar ABC transporter permease [Anaerolineaceae bacterium]MDD4042514.1 sugar ABC transporter permease [Anaerolineaceae bacterium]MDD4578508.1 sugar ABC transporter permease [Anaerolineaceae bacterium]